MSFDIHQLGSIVPDSFSRKLDDMVERTEMPYGYTNNPPPADTDNYNQRALESNKQYRTRKGRAV